MEVTTALQKSVFLERAALVMYGATDESAKTHAKLLHSNEYSGAIHIGFRFLVLNKAFVR